jgi:hypothetical protein
MDRRTVILATGLVIGSAVVAIAATGLVQLDNAQLRQVIPGSEQASVQLVQNVPPERRLTIVRNFHPSGSFSERRTGTAVALRRTPPGRGEAPAGAVATVIDTGSWWIEGNRLCVRYDRWFDRRNYCSPVERHPTIRNRVVVRLGPIDPDTPTEFDIKGPAAQPAGPGEHEKGAGGGGGGGGQR